MSGTTFCCLKAYRAFIRREVGIRFSMHRITQGRRSALTCSDCMCSKMEHSKQSSFRSYMERKALSSKHATRSFSLPVYQVCLQRRKRDRTKMQLERDANGCSEEDFYKGSSSCFPYNGRKDTNTNQPDLPGICLPELEETPELQELAGQSTTTRNSPITISRCPTCGQRREEALGESDSSLDQQELLPDPITYTQTETIVDTWGDRYGEDWSNYIFDELFSQL